MGEQLPPQDLTSEKAVLGALLYDPAALVLIPQLRPDHFYRNAHKEVFAQMLALFDEKKGFDEIVLSAALKRTSSQIQSVTELLSIKNSVPSSAMVEQHAALVRTTASARSLMALGHNLLRDVETRDPLEAAANATAALDGVTAASGMEEPVKFAQALKEFQEEETTTAHPTGLGSLDEAMGGGLHYGGIVLVGGDAKSGKTLLAMEMAREAMKYHTPTYVVSRDQLRHHIAGRMWAGHAKVEREHIRESVRASELVPEMEQWPLYFHPAAFDLATITAYIKIAVATKGIKIWIVDYLQRLTVDTGKETRASETSVIIADRLSDLAQDTNTAGVVISRVTKPSPGMSSQHRFSGEAGVQNSNDGMLFVHKMEDENEDLNTIFWPDALRTIEVMGGRHWGASVVTTKMAGAQDRYIDMNGPGDDPNRWTESQRISWSEYRDSKKRRKP